MSEAELSALINLSFWIGSMFGMAGAAVIWLLGDLAGTVAAELTRIYLERKSGAGEKD